MRLAWAFGAESLATHPFRIERGKSGPPSSSLDRRKAGPAPREPERKIFHLDRWAEAGRHSVS